MTIREQILQAIKTALIGTSGVGTSVFRSRPIAIGKTELPSLTINAGIDDPTTTSVDRITWENSFQVIVALKSDTPDTDADNTVADIHSRLLGSTDLNAILVNIEAERVSWQFIDADKPCVFITMQFKATYQTKRADLTAAA